MFYLEFFGSVILFVLLEYLIHISFIDHKKISEIINIFTFLLCAFWITGSSVVLSVLGGLLMVIAILLDFYRRKTY